MDAPARDHEDLLALLAAGVEDCSIMLLDADGCVRTWNERAPRFQDYQSGDVVGRHFSVLYPPADIEAGKPERELSAAAAEGHLENEGWRVRKDGTQVWANVVITALREPDGTLRGFGKIMRDLTGRRTHERAILEREQLVTGVLAACTEYAITGTDLDGTITIFNTGAERMLGYRAEEMVGLRSPAVFHDADEVAARAEELGIAPGLGVFVGAARRLEPETRDVSDRKRYETQLQYLANHDPLTGLFNRARLDEALKAHVTRVQRYGAVGALLLIDLDQFKSVNDRLGHTVGDRLLINVARIMQSRTRDTDVLTRRATAPGAVDRDQPVRSLAGRSGTGLAHQRRDRHLRRGSRPAHLRAHRDGGDREHQSGQRVRRGAHRRGLSLRARRLRRWFRFLLLPEISAV